MGERPADADGLLLPLPGQSPLQDRRAHLRRRQRGLLDGHRFLDDPLAPGDREAAAGGRRVTSPDAVPGRTDLTALAPLALGLLMLCRLVPSWSWLGRWPTAFVIGTTAGYGLVRYIRSDFVYQIRATVGRGLYPMVDGRWLWQESLAALVILVGTLSGIVYFINTREHRGAYGRVARLGLMFMLVTFGASFGSAVMARIALLIGRFQELLGDWLGLMS